MDEINKIASRDNEHLKYARRVRDGREGGKIFLEGLRLVGEAARSGTVIECVFVSSEVQGEPEISELLERLQPQKVFQTSQQLLQSLADTNNAQGIIAVGQRPESRSLSITSSNSDVASLVIFLNRINNPSNLGAVIRTAEAAGVAGLIISEGSADAFSAKALRAAMGSSLRIPIWTGAGFDEAIEWAGQNKLRTTAADIRAERSYTDVDWKIPRLVVFGSEAHGLSEDELEKIEDLIVIPTNDVESLNIAVACGVIMFEARRQSLFS